MPNSVPLAQKTAPLCFTVEWLYKGLGVRSGAGFICVDRVLGIKEEFGSCLVCVTVR